MKILYAIQGTGNGHLSRAIEIIPHLMKQGEVDILVSGISADLELPFHVNYRLHGWSYIFGKRGGIDYLSTFRKTRLFNLIREIRNLPVHQYDLVISDFEPVTAWACLLRKKKCIGLSNQAAIIAGKLEKPKYLDPIGQLILRYYAPCTVHYGFHFSNLGPGFYAPVIRTKIRNLKVSNQGHYTVYLPAHDDGTIYRFLSQVKGVRWEVFSKHNRYPLDYGRISIRPIQEDAFLKSLSSAEGVLCAAGFATASEALFLKKKLMVIPMKNQIEQHYNALALSKMGVPVLPSLNSRQISQVGEWIKKSRPVEVEYPDQTAQMVEDMVRNEYQTNDYYTAYLTKDQFHYLPS